MASYPLRIHPAYPAWVSFLRDQIPAANAEYRGHCTAALDNGATVLCARLLVSGDCKPEHIEGMFVLLFSDLQK